MPSRRRQNIGRRTRASTRVFNSRNSQVNEIDEQPNATITLERLAFRYDPTINYAADVSVDFGTMSTVCQHCNAFRFRHEPPGLCCASGKVKLPQLTQPPEPLASLLSDREPLSKHFLHNIQKYNSTFQMTSFGANIAEERGFSPTFKVNSFLTATHITKLKICFQFTDSRTNPPSCRSIVAASE